MKYDYEKINCDFCGENNFKRIFLPYKLRGDVKKNGAIHVCKTCSLISLNPRFTIETYSEFYKKEYRNVVNIDSAYDSIQDTLNSSIQRGSGIVKFCESYLNKDAKILEIGSGNGGILYAFKLAGYQNLLGVEPNQAESKFTNEVLNIPTINSMFENLSEQKFDLIVIAATIDHIQEPSIFFTNIRNYISKGGFVYMDSHEIISQIIAGDVFFKMDHCYYYSPLSILLLLNKNGFNIFSFEACNLYLKEPLYIRTKRNMWKSDFPRSFQLLASPSKPLDVDYLVKRYEKDIKKDVRIIFKYTILNFLFPKKIREIIIRIKY